MQATDYYYATSGGKVTAPGNVGVTDVEVSDLVYYLGKQVTSLKNDEIIANNKYAYVPVGTQYKASHLTNVIGYYEAAIESIKAAKTSYAIAVALDTLESQVKAEKTVGQTMAAIFGDGAYASAGYVICSDYTKTSVMPGYNWNTYAGGYNLRVLPSAGYKTHLYTSDTNYQFSNNDANDTYVLEWFLDNGYETYAAVTSEGAKTAFENALVKVNTVKGDYSVYKVKVNSVDTYTTDAVVAAYEWEGLVDAIKDAKITDFDAVYNAKAAIKAFEKKWNNAKHGKDDYGVWKDTGTNSATTTKYNNALAYYWKANFEKDYDKVTEDGVAKALDNKDKIVELAKAIDEFDTKYDETYMTNHSTGLDALLDAIEAPEVRALTAKFNALGVAAPEDLTAADKAAFDEYAAAYDAYKAEFYDSGLYDATYCTIPHEAYILAGKANFGINDKAEGIEKSNVQTYLNNANLKVTTTALGNGRVRAQANFTSDDLQYIANRYVYGVDGKIATVEPLTLTYQFYWKKAANTEYKAGKIKDVNYSTFKLAKGVKYNFHCQVVVKDKDGNVVATKDYKASSIGTRTAK